MPQPPSRVLIASSGEVHTDRVLQRIVGEFERSFPDRICGYYVIGSFVEASSNPISDLDCIVVFDAPLSQADQSVVDRLTESIASSTKRRLDVAIEIESSLSAIAAPALKFGSLLVYGNDIRDHIALPDLEQYRREVTWLPYRLFGQIIHSTDLLRYPLSFPDPEGEFFGYDLVRLPEWYQPGTRHGLKEWVSGISRMATALIALQGGKYVSGKAYAVTAYRRFVGDEWADLVTAAFQLGKLRWQYMVPESPEERLLLRDLCQRSLGFQNHYFTLYRKFLLSRLISDDPADQRFAAERLRCVFYNDTEMLTALKQRRSTGSPDAQAAVSEVLGRWSTY